LIKLHFEVEDDYWAEKRKLSEKELAETKDGKLFIDCAYVSPGFFPGNRINFGFFFVKNIIYFILIQQFFQSLSFLRI
jgi:hypothetical protein